MMYNLGFWIFLTTSAFIRQLLHPARDRAVRHEVRRRPDVPGDRRLSEGEHGDGAVADVRAGGGHVGGAVHPHGGPADVGHAPGRAHQDKGEKRMR